MELSDGINVTVQQQRQLTGIALIICGAAVLCSMFYAMSTPSTPKPPATPAQLLADVIVTKTNAFTTCVEDAYRQHKFNTLSAQDHEDITTACAQATSEVTQNAEQKLQSLVVPAQGAAPPTTIPCCSSTGSRTTPNSNDDP